MAEQLTFESRLETALSRYADRVPVQVDVAGVVRAAATPRGLPSRVPARPTWGTLLRLGAVAALLAVAAVIALVVAQQDSKPLHGGGRLLVGVRTSGWVFDPSLAAPVQVELGSTCQLVDGGTQLVQPGRFNTPTRVQPVGTDGASALGVTSLTIPGFGGTNSERWSPDGSRYALMRFGSQDGNPPLDGPGALMVLSIHGAKDPVRQIFEIRGASGFAWSRDSRSIAVIGRLGDQFELIVVDVAAGTQRVVTTSNVEIALNPGGAWTAGDSVIVMTMQTPDGYRPAIVDVAGGLLRRLPDPDGLLVGSIGWTAWAPDGKRAILMGEAGPIAGVDPDGRKIFDMPSGQLLYDPRQFEYDPWAPDSRQFALTDGSTLRLVHADGRAIEVAVLPPPVEGSTPPVGWSPDGTSIAVADTTTAGLRIRILDALDLHEQAAAIVPTSLDGVPCLHWAPPVR